MALMQVKGGGWLLIASLYLWTGQPLHSDGNSAILSAVVEWIIKLGLPWMVAADWHNDPEALTDSHFNSAVHGVVKSSQEHTCRSKGTLSKIDYFWMDHRLAGTVRQPKVLADALSPAHTGNGRVGPGVASLLRQDIVAAKTMARSQATRAAAESAGLSGTVPRG